MADEVRVPDLLERQVGPDRYVRVFLPVHPDARDGWVLLHRLVLEAALGGRLPAGTEVHHRDGNPGNNAIENLQLLPRELHRAMHAALDRDEARTKYECDGWAADSMDILRLHYADARKAVPYEWSTRAGAARLAEKARRTKDGKALEVLEGLHDARIEAARGAKTPASVLAAEMGVPESVVIQRFRMLNPAPVIRRADKRGDRSR